MWSVKHLSDIADGRMGPLCMPGKSSFGWPTLPLSKPPHGMLHSAIFWSFMGRGAAEPTPKRSTEASAPARRERPGVPKLEPVKDLSNGRVGVRAAGIP